MSITYYHYGASVVHAPLDQLRGNMSAILNMPLARPSATAQTLTYRATACAPGIAEYTVTCTLQPMEDAPAATFVEWMRAYRPAAAAGQEQIHSFGRALATQDHAVADQLATVDDSAETLFMDYTLGDTDAL
jgi:hypothetical protein